MPLSKSNINRKPNSIKKKKLSVSKKPSFARTPSKQRNKVVMYITCGGSLTKLNWLSVECCQNMPSLD